MQTLANPGSIVIAENKPPCRRTLDLSVSRMKKGSTASLFLST
jgi:hypothetical protein